MTTETRQRLFFALWPPPELARQLHRLAKQLFRDPDARLLHADQIHLTLLYLGATDAEQRACLEALAEQLRVEPFQLTLTTAGYWARPRVGWVAPAATPPAFVRLVSQLQQGLPACGFAHDPRPWQAHLTLARKLRRPPVNAGLAESRVWPVSEFVLVESQTLPTGAEYRILQHWPLIGQAHQGNQRID